MELSEFTFRIILLFIPGIVAYIIVDNLTFHREFKIYQSLTFSLVLGFICYMLYFPISLIVPSDWGLPIFSFDQVLMKSDAAINLNEVTVVTLLAILIGVVLSGLINAKWHYWILRSIKVTKKTGNCDVWISSMYDKKLKNWVVIRDFKNKLRYEGWVEHFSDTVETRELLLRDVAVYQLKAEIPYDTSLDSTKYLYSSPALYLSLVNAFSIEFTKAPYIHKPLELEGGNSKDAKQQAAIKADPISEGNAQAAATITTTYSRPCSRRGSSRAGWSTAQTIRRKWKPNSLRKGKKGCQTISNQ